MSTLILEPGSTSVCINITIIDDLEPETEVEFFALNITSTDVTVNLVDSLADVSILNNESM